jgi:uncharacterized membrane protein
VRCSNNWSASQTTRKQDHERGAILPLLMLVAALLLVTTIVVVGLGQRTVARAKAQHAADAAALAGAGAGQAAAQSFATANDAELLEFELDQAQVWVLVERNGVRAEARAEQRLEISR